MAKRGCYMDVDFDLRYNVCPRCGFVRRAWGMKPLLHKGRKNRG